MDEKPETSIFEPGFDDEPYQPLQRPSLIPEAQTSTQDEPEIDDHYSSFSSSDDSDDDKIQMKRAKVAKPALTPRKQSLNKYNVWSNRAQEDSLLETFNSCDVTYVNRSRDIESYPFESAPQERKRKVARRRMKNESEPEEEEVVPVVLMELSEDYMQKNDEELGHEIAQKLNEVKEDLICKVIKTFGKEKAAAIFNEVRAIELKGGMSIVNGNRRRTPGGVFLNLVKQHPDLTRDQRDFLFKEDFIKFKEQLKAQRKQKNNALKSEIKKEREEMLAKESSVV